MRLIYFHQYFSLPTGSTGTRSYEFSKYLVSKGHEVLIVTGGYKVSDTGLSGSFQNGIRRGVLKNGVEIIEIELLLSNNFSLLKRSWLFLKFIAKTIPIVFKEKYDIIFVTSTPLTVVIPGLIAKLFRGKTFIFEVRDLWPELPKAMQVVNNFFVLMALKLLASYAYKKADHIIGLSPGIVDGIKSYGVDEKKITFIPNGCDNDLFDTKDTQRLNDINFNDFVAIFAGAHGEANGLDILIPVAEELKNREINNIKFLLIGDGKVKTSLIQKTKELNLEDIIIFYDPVNKYELAKIFQSCDIGLQILANVEEFYYGTSPNKFFDYISAGLPVLNNYPGWLNDVINDNNSGIIVKPDDHIDFCEKIIYASKSPDKLKQMSINSKKIAKEIFDRKLLSKDFLNTIEKMEINK